MTKEIKKEYIKDFEVKNLVPYSKNPRINDKAVDGVIKSIKRNGNIDPVEVDEDNIILTGHSRLKAFKKMKIETADVIRVTGLTEAQKKSYRVEHNKTNELAEWDMDLLQEDFTMEELEDMDFDMTAELAEDEETEVVEDEAPELKEKSIVKLGDIWTLGKHRLMCGDSTDAGTVSLLMEGKKADMVFTDPPYNTGMSEKTNSGSTRLNHMFNDSFTEEEWQNLMKCFCKNYFDFMKDDTVAYICLDWRKNHELIPHIKEHFKLSNVIIWDKMVHGLGSDYKYTYELLNVCKKGKPKMDTHQGDREYSDVWHIQRKMGRDEEHATKKPLELVARALRHSSKKDNIILDLFGGSFSTMIACHQLNRTFYGMELDPRYCDVGIKRIIKLDPNIKIKRNGEEIDKKMFDL